MELILILRVLLRRWWLVVLPVVIVGVLVAPDLVRVLRPGGGGFSVTIRYTAHQSLDAFPNRQGDYQDVWLASEFLVNAMTDWIRTTSFNQEVAAVTAQNGVEIDPAALTIAAENDKSTGRIVVSGPNETELTIIAEAILTVLGTRNHLYLPQVGENSATVIALDELRIAPAPPPLTDRFGPIIRLALGLFAGLVLAFLVEYLDPRVRRREELANLGLEVIASVPRNR